MATVLQQPYLCFLFDCVSKYSLGFCFMETYLYVFIGVGLKITGRKGGFEQGLEFLRPYIFKSYLVLVRLDLPNYGISESSECYFRKIYLERKEKLINPLFLSLDLMA